MWAYLRPILLGLDITINAILGGAAYQSLSCRVGVSILGGTWASRIDWPDWLHRHFVEAVFETTV
jgi:hypothetical protein